MCACIRVLLNWVATLHFLRDKRYIHVRQFSFRLATWCELIVKFFIRAKLNKRLGRPCNSMAVISCNCEIDPVTSETRIVLWPFQQVFNPVSTRFNK